MTNKWNSSAREGAHNHQKKIAAINDLSGFGRCSLTVTLPVLSQMKVQCCPVPTSILSNHTGFDSCFFEDFTPNLPAYLAEWRRLGLTFDGICSGFLGSEEQISLVENFLEEFRRPGTVVLVDPVMGDNGRPYDTYTSAMCGRMRELAERADILTPNLTEACILAERPYKEKWRMAELEGLMRALVALGPRRIVITGIQQGSFVANYCCEQGKAPWLVRTQRVGTPRCGTGDIFAAILAADAVNGSDFGVSVRKASRFIKKCIVRSAELDIPPTDGVCFEEYLHELK